MEPSREPIAHSIVNVVGKDFVVCTLEAALTSQTVVRNISGAAAGKLDVAGSLLARQHLGGVRDAALPVTTARVRTVNDARILNKEERQAKRPRAWTTECTRTVTSRRRNQYGGEDPSFGMTELVNGRGSSRSGQKSGPSLSTS